MKIVMDGGHRLLADSTPEHVVPFAQFVLEKFVLSKRIRNNITLDIVFTDTVHRDNMWGKAEVLSKRPRAARDFRISVSATGLPFHNLMVTLAHELVHVKQWVLGELMYLNTGEIQHARWHGQKRILTSNKMEYWDRPWEIEANGYSKGLVEQYILTNRLDHLEWLDAAIV